MNSNNKTLNKSDKSELKKNRILIVEDESLISAYIKKVLEKSGYTVYNPVSTAMDALMITEKEKPDLVIMDISLEGGMDGIDAAEKIQKNFNIPVIYLTAYTDDATLARAKKTSPYGYLVKPFKEEAIPVIEIALYKHRADEESRRVESLIMSQRDLALKLSGSTEINDTLNLCIETAMKVSEMDSGGVYLLDEKKGGLYLACSKGVSRGFIDKVAYFDSDSKSAMGVLKGDPIYLNGNVLFSSRNILMEAYLDEGLTYLAVIPVKNDGRVIASLAVASHIKKDVSHYVSVFLETTAAQMGRSIENGQNLALLKERELKYRLLAENVSDIIWAFNADYLLTYISPSIEKLMGDTLKSMDNLTVDRLISPESFTLLKNNIEKRKKKIEKRAFQPFSLDLDFFKSEGADMTTESVISIIHTGDAPARFLGVSRDITERRLAEKRLQESVRVHKTVLNNIDEMIFQIDLQGTVFFVNNSTLKHYKLSLDEIYINKIPFFFFWCDRSIEDVKNAIGTVLKTRKEKNLDCKCGDNYYQLDLDPVIENGEVTSIICAARDITERRLATEKLKKALDASVNIIVKIIETEDPYTAGHQRNVAELAKSIAMELKLSDESVNLVWSTALVHDIGKIDIPSEILSKPGKLSDNEMLLIRDHPQVGYNILKSEYPSPFPDIVMQHHERLNGTGYPLGLKGGEILMEARIIAVADVIEAIAANRPYRPSLGIDKAIEEITINKNILYDPKVVDAATGLFRLKNFSFIDFIEK